jgi:hypothetical protein
MMPETIQLRLHDGRKETGVHRIGYIVIEMEVKNILSNRHQLELMLLVVATLRPSI